MEQLKELEDKGVALESILRLCDVEAGRSMNKVRKVMEVLSGTQPPINYNNACENLDNVKRQFRDRIKTSEGRLLTVQGILENVASTITESNSVRAKYVVRSTENTEADREAATSAQANMATLLRRMEQSGLDWTRP